WQIALVPLSKVARAVIIYFEVYQLETTLTAVAFDDIVIDQCSSFIPTTTSTSTITIRSTLTTTSTVTTVSISTSTTTLVNNAPE
ncbi:unnamed protein product, partial [Rotaria sp. Silwood2]